MSDQSEQIETLLHELNAELHKRHENAKESEKHEVAQTLLKEELSSAEAGMHYYAHEAHRRIYILFRQWLGAKKFESVEEAITATKPGVKRAFVDHYLRVFSDGVQLGQGSGHAVRKYRWFKKEEELYAYDGFRQESELLAFRFGSDFETLEIFERHFEGATESVTRSTGYSKFGVESANEKLWDMWMLVCMGSMTQLFLGGVRLGKIWKEQDTLAGILSATEEASSPDGNSA